MNSSSSWLTGSESVRCSSRSSGTFRYLLYESSAPLPYSLAIMSVGPILRHHPSHVNLALSERRQLACVSVNTRHPGSPHSDFAFLCVLCGFAGNPPVPPQRHKDGGENLKIKIKNKKE